MIGLAPLASIPISAKAEALSADRSVDWLSGDTSAFVLSPSRAFCVDWSANTFILDASDALAEGAINLFTLDVSENAFAADVVGPDARAGGDLYDESDDAILDEWGDAIIAA